MKKACIVSFIILGAGMQIMYTRRVFLFIRSSLFLGLLCMGFQACSSNNHNNQLYYRLHPDILQKTLEKCPEHSDSAVSCDELNVIAKEVNSLAYELQNDPQGFGKVILTLQQTIAKQEKETSKNNVEATIEKNKQELASRLAIVKWLESPEG